MPVICTGVFAFMQSPPAPSYLCCPEHAQPKLCEAFTYSWLIFIRKGKLANKVEKSKICE